MKAVVTAPVCPLMTRPQPHCAQADEVLCGMVVEVLDKTAPDYWHVRTHYRYEGYAKADCLLTQDPAGWEAKGKKVVLHKDFADVLARPEFRSWPLLSVPKGAVLALGGEEAEPGWTSVELPDGRLGWLRESWLGAHFTAPPALPEAGLRRRLVELALGYRGTPYRWGGKTPMGIDCSGLVSMAYLLSGIVIWRDALIMPDFDLVEIPLSEAKPGDALFFPGHVALYMGEGRYVHATGRAGSDGVAVNSLDPAHPDYRADLAGSVTQVGSYVGFHRGREGGRPRSTSW